MVSEVVAAIFVIIFLALVYIEKAAGKTGGFGRYAWLARGLRRLLFFAALGMFLIFVGTDWHNAFWERTIGTLCLFIGIGLFIRTVLRRREIQEGLASGRIKPGE